ncbi:UNVERIFIED_CONTAM: hypothetical protein RMT77_011925 [Armadillidium vulgare]
MSSDITISCNALAKILLHTAKYPHLAVSGVLLSTSKKNDTSETFILDAIPLFHGQLGLAPMLEVALTQIERVFKSEGLTIAGYYQANELLKDYMPDFVAMKIAEKIAENNNEACLIMVDNRKVSLNLDTVPFVVSQLTADGKWKNKEKTGVHLESGSLEITSQLLQKKVHRDISDFDNHLDDITCDWTNKQIGKLVGSLISAAGF